MKRVTILGAGMSGLSCAYFLVQRGWTVRILESESRAGGMISTIHSPQGLIETAANGFIATALLESIAQDIGVELQTTRPTARRRFICHESPSQWPLGFWETLRLIPRLLQIYFFPKAHQPEPRQTLRQWGEAHLGAMAFERLLAVAIQGIYAGDPDQLSATFLLRRFFDRRRKLPRGRLRGTVSPKQGMGQWIEKLEQYLVGQGVTIEYGAAPIDLPTREPVIVATSMASAAQILKRWGLPAGETLEKMPTVSLVSIAMFWEPNSAISRRQGFGILFSQRRYPGILGVLMNDLIFENRSELWSETWILGGFAAPEIVTKTDAELLEMVQSHRRSIVAPGIPGPVCVGHRIQRWPQALPHYTVQLEQTVETLKVPENVFLVGNYLGEIGLSHLIARAQRLADELEKKTS
jgi:oxygen-dependent protoporphyrinogen oxidase